MKMYSSRLSYRCHMDRMVVVVDLVGGGHLRVPHRDLDTLWHLGRNCPNAIKWSRAELKEPAVIAAATSAFAAK